MQSSHLYLKVEIHIFTVNLKGMLLWYISEKVNLGYEDTTRNGFQVWPFKRKYSFFSPAAGPPTIHVN